MKLVWRSRPSPTSSSIVTSVSPSVAPSTAASNVNLNEKAAQSPVTVTEAAAAVALAAKEKPKADHKWKWSWKLSAKKEPKSASSDEEKGSTGRQERPIRLFAPFYGGLGIGLATCQSHYLATSMSTHWSAPSLHCQWSCYSAARVAPRSRLHKICFARHITIPSLCVAGELP